MEDATIRLDTPEMREASIGRMVEQLHNNFLSLPAGSLEQRTCMALMDLMPNFLRMLDRERILLVHAITRLRAVGGDEFSAVEDLMQVVATPTVNMIGTTLMALVPCHHDDARCERCAGLRSTLMKEMLLNIAEGVKNYISTKDVPHTAARLNGKQLHS